jgi:transcriptional regulator with XRE-family HTH domain
MSLGQRLREERERLGYTQTDFAALAGASKRSQIGWEQGRSNPDAAVLAEWEKVGLDVVYVVTGDYLSVYQAKVLLANRSLAEKAPSYSNRQAPAALPPEQSIDKLSPREKALIENYRGSTEEGRRAVETAASALSHGCDSKKKDKKKSGK